jgi:hypothetical protein
MTADIWAKIIRFVDTATERFRRNIHPTEGDRVWFDRNNKSNNGRPRRYRVRDSIASDHWVFKIGGHSPKGSITVISRSPPTMAVLSAREDVFGYVINSDEYAMMRLQYEIDQPDVRSVPA